MFFFGIDILIIVQIHALIASLPASSLFNCLLAETKRFPITAKMQ
jgi:hypothetical protein